ncbi:MAG: GNAT family N-acetyltransferase [Chitinophagaceae bacterium]
MEDNKTSIIPYEEKYREQVVSVWERSARATHHFVSLDDFVYYKQAVSKIDFFSFSVHCLLNKNKVIGILGVADFNIQMLFIDADFIGRGLGKKLMLFALKELGANKVDVNEQNTKAVNFYSRFGFVTYDRTEKDAEGKDYPILKMKLHDSVTIFAEEISIRLLNKDEEIPYELLLDADPSKKLVDNYISKGETYLALKAGETVGVCILVRINKETIEIKNLAVAEKIQGKGIGTIMIEYAFEIAKRKGCKTILIATSTPNIGPLYLYQKMGFEYDYIIKHYFDNNIHNYDEPLFDNGIKCNHMIVLSKRL